MATRDFSQLIKFHPNIEIGVVLMRLWYLLQITLVGSLNMRTFSQKSAGVCSFVKSMYMYNMEAEYPKQFRDEINWLFFVNHLDAWGLFLCWFVFNIQNCCHLLRLFLSLKIHQLYPCKKEKCIFFWDNWFV